MTKSRSIVCFFVFMLPFFLLADSTLNVQGEGRVTVPANLVTFSVGVTTDNDTASGALQANSTLMNSLIAGLQASGLTKNEFQTGQFRLQPKFSKEGERITGYTALNSLTVRTKQISRIGELIDQATKSGANTITSLSFSLDDSTEAEHKAIQKAAEEAISQAKLLAEASGVKLDKIKEISLIGAPFPKVQGLYARAFDSSTPIEAGEIEVSATVTVQFAIQ